MDACDAAVTGAIADGVFPGATVMVLCGGAVRKRAAYGHAVLYQDATRRLVHPLPAAPDTVFDLASLTKLFTATAVLLLVDQGEVTLDAPARRYLPAFARGGRETITVRQLLAHTSGLPPGRPLYRRLRGAATITAAAGHTRLAGPPGGQVLYSDLNYISLGGIVEAAGGAPLDRFLTGSLLEPLGMRDTGYCPAPALVARAAATEYQEGRGMVRGVVHDENAAAMGGVSGHAGLFSTVDDLARFGALFLHEGAHNGRQILRPETVRQMLSVQTAGLRPARGLGWLCADPTLMGGLAAAGAAGHTGFTGTSIVLEPRRALCVILLTNRVHPTRRGPSLAAVRAAVADAAAQLGREA